jgi:hypothetical protein
MSGLYVYAFSAGIYVDAGKSNHRLQLTLPWGTTEVFAAQRSAWDLTQVQSWSHQLAWSLTLSQLFTAGYGLRLETGHRLRYGDLRLHLARLLVPFGERYSFCVYLRMPYGERTLSRWSMRQGWWLTEAINIRHALNYAVSTTNPLSRRFVGSWSLLADQSLQAVANLPELVWQGQRLRLTQATLSCDEDSPVWLASIELAELADFAAIGITDELSLTLGLETFRFIVDGKTLSRESMTSQRCEVTAVSPVALLDAPFAGALSFQQANALSAQDAVELLIGSVEWQLPNWLIPAGRLLLENVTPLQAARNIVASIGGIIESNPDGSLVARRRHPVSIPQYDAATVAHELFDSEVLTASSRIAPNRGYNRVTIANEEGAQTASSDSIEYIAEPLDARRGQVRAWLNPARPVVLVHTGHPATVITARGSVTRTETEFVEFIEGNASTRYAVSSITRTQWQHTDLGIVSAEGKTLTAAVPGYSLLLLTYTTQSIAWDVALSVDEEVQFVLTDA